MTGIIFHSFDVIVLTGIAQAMIIAVVILHYGTAKPDSRLFSAILITLALLSTKILLHTTGAWQLPAFHYFPLAIDTLLPLLLYAYLLAATGEPMNNRRFTLYLLPTCLLLLHALVVYILTLGKVDMVAKDRVAESLYYNQVKTLEDVLTLIFALAAWVMGYRKLRIYRAWLYSTQSDSRFQEYGWLKNLLVSSGVLAAIFSVVLLLEDVLQAGNHDFIFLEIFYIYLAGLSHYLSLKGYALYALATDRPPLVVPEEPEQVISQALSDDQLLIKNKILASLEKGRLYLDPELSLKDLAHQIGCPASVVSTVINQGFGQNFRNLVNSYRVNAVQEMLQNPPSHLSLLGIALECGFNSEASFYRTFRQFTGLSPNNYLQKINAQNRF
jgi:AraC-like DNA-binding protein